MAKRKPSKPTPLDEPAATGRTAPEPIDDPSTMTKLDALKAPDLDDAEPPAAALARVPEQKRAEVSSALKARIQRIRRFALGEIEDADV